MSCAQHSFGKSRKSEQTNESYCRNADWWKKSDIQSPKENAPSRYVYPRQSYITRRRAKHWSLMVLSGMQRLTEAEAKFHYYASKWKEEIGGDSSLTNITSNMNYLRIIAIGDDAIPLILQELQKQPAPWFVALRAISEDDSVGRNSPGDFRKKAADWIQWGREHGRI